MFCTSAMYQILRVSFANLQCINLTAVSKLIVHSYISINGRSVEEFIYSFVLNIKTKASPDLVNFNIVQSQNMSSYKLVTCITKRTQALIRLRILIERKIVNILSEIQQICS